MSINFGELSNRPSALCLTTNYHYKSSQNPQIQEQCPTDAADISLHFKSRFYLFIFINVKYGGIRLLILVLSFIQFCII